MSHEPHKPRTTLRPLSELAAAAARAESGPHDLSPAEEQLLSLAMLVATGKPVASVPHVERPPARYRVR